MSESAELRQVRGEAHRLFDQFWLCKRYCGDRSAMRKSCYDWLRFHTGMAEQECHFGQFDMGVCLAVIELCKQSQAGLIEPPRMRKAKPHRATWEVRDKSVAGSRSSKKLKQQIKNKRF